MSTSHEVKARKKSKRRAKPTASFDIKVRSFVYSGVPGETHNSLHHKGIIQRKQCRDKVAQRDRDRGCTKFMYRNSKALQFEKEQLQRGGDVDALGREAVAWNSALGDSTRPRSLGLDTHMSASDGLLRTGVLKHYYQDQKPPGPKPAAQATYDSDPNKHLYLAAALGSLELKNERTNNANGNIVEMLEPKLGKV